MWWLSTILVLTHALLLIHVSEVSGIKFELYDEPPEAPEKLATDVDAVRSIKNASINQNTRNDNIDQQVRSMTSSRPNFQDPYWRRPLGIFAPVRWNQFRARNFAAEPAAPVYGFNTPVGRTSPPIAPVGRTSPPTVPSSNTVTNPLRSSALSNGENKAPQNPSTGKSTSDVSGAPSVKPQPSRSPSNTGAQSPSVQSPPSRSSSNLDAQTNKPDYTKYEYAPDGRRLAGEQNLTWPVKGGSANITDAGPQLGEEFKGILIAQNIIPTIKAGIEDFRKSSVNAVDDHTKGNVQSARQPFRINFPAGWEKLIDVKLINKAIREAQGDFEDYDHPDPWTNETIYCPKVLELNKKLHNEFRARHYAQPLEYMNEIHPVAHAYANKLAKEIALYGIDRFQHNTDVQKKLWGENLFTSTSGFDGRAPTSIVEAGIRSFYKENENYKDYDEKDPKHSTGIIGHFTALVWRSTSRMGLGLAKYTHNNKTTYVMVVNYYITGNVGGYYDTNVIRAGAFDNHMEDLPEPVNPYEKKEKPKPQQVDEDNFMGSLFGK